MPSVYTRKTLLLLAAGALVSALLCVAATHHPYFPTDVALTRVVQAALAGPTGWAAWITATADKPGCFLLLAITVVLALIISGWRAALLSIPIFFGLWGFGVWLSPIAAQPRPSAELIAVVGHPKGYAFPSLFGLIYVATFGYVGALALARLRGPMRWAVAIPAAGALLIGAAARIVLGAHWPSDLWVAYLIGLVWIGALIPLSRGDVETSHAATAGSERRIKRA